MKKTVGHLLVLAVLIIGSLQVYGQDAEEISTDSLPDVSAPDVPPEVEKSRIESLIKNLPETRDLENIFPSDLSRPDVQKAIIESNPFLVTLFPPKTKLHEDSMSLMAEKFYRFDFFIPEYLRNQSAVKEAFKKNAKRYVKEFRKYKEEGQKFLHEGHGRTLIHPDLFYDSTFVFIFMHTCSPSRRSYDPRIPPHPRQAKKEPAPLSPMESFYYFKNKGVFDKLHKQIFLAKHPNHPLADNCYPVDFLRDADFIRKMNDRFPHSNFVAKGVAENDSPELKEIYYDSLVKKLETENYQDRILKIVKPEDWKSEKLQAWLFNNPDAFKRIELAIEVDPTQLENFVKNQYKPARYFSETQKQSQLYADILAKHPNEGEEFLKAGKDAALTQLGNIKCCGPSYSDGIRNFVTNSPPEFFQDNEFIITALKKIRIHDDFLRLLIHKHGLSKSLKSYLLENCKSLWGVRHWAQGGTPKAISEDKKFFEEFKESCK